MVNEKEKINFERSQNDYDIRAGLGIGNTDLNLIKGDYLELGNYINKPLGSASIETVDFRKIEKKIKSLTNIFLLILNNYLEINNIKADFFMPTIDPPDSMLYGKIGVSGYATTSKKVFARYTSPKNYQLYFLTNRNNNEFAIRIYGDNVSDQRGHNHDEYDKIHTLKNFDIKMKKILKKYNIF